MANVITIVSDESLPERSDPYLLEEEITKRMVEILKEHEMTPYEYSKIAVYPKAAYIMSSRAKMELKYQH